MIQASPSTPKRLWREPTKEELLPLGKYEQTRKALGVERMRDYNDYLRDVSTASSKRCEWKEPIREEVIDLGRYEKTRKALGVERMRDYNDYLRDVSTASLRKQEIVKPTLEKTFELGNDEKRRKVLEEERAKDFNDYVRDISTASTNRLKEERMIEPHYEYFLVGKELEESQDKMRRERWEEYNNILKRIEHVSLKSILCKLWVL